MFSPVAVVVMPSPVLFYFHFSFVFGLSSPNSDVYKNGTGHQVNDAYFSAKLNILDFLDESCSFDYWFCKSDSVSKHLILKS